MPSLYLHPPFARAIGKFVGTTISEFHVVPSNKTLEIATALLFVEGDASTLAYWLLVTKITGFGVYVKRTPASWNCGNEVFAEVRMLFNVGLVPRIDKNSLL